jgi:hypothetical protein
MQIFINSAKTPDNMDERIMRMNDGLAQLVQPYLGQQEYGNLLQAGTGEEPHKITDLSCFWFYSYNRLSGSAPLLAIEFSDQRHSFNSLRVPGYLQHETRDPIMALEIFGQWLNYIKVQRQSDLRRDAKDQIAVGVGLDSAVAKMTTYAATNPLFGPTEKELHYYKKFYAMTQATTPLPGI